MRRLAILGWGFVMAGLIGLLTLVGERATRAQQVDFASNRLLKNKHGPLIHTKRHEIGGLVSSYFVVFIGSADGADAGPSLYLPIQAVSSSKSKSGH